MSKSFIFVGGLADGWRETIKYPEYAHVMHSFPKISKDRNVTDETEILAPLAPIEAEHHQYTMRKIRAGETTHHFYGYESLSDSECIALLIMKYPLPTT